jgi:hypothetical protein
LSRFVRSAVVVAIAVVLVLAALWAARPDGQAPSQGGPQTGAAQGDSPTVPTVLGYPAVDSPSVPVPEPLPQQDGTVDVNLALNMRPGSASLADSGGLALARFMTGRSAAAASAAAAPETAKVTLRALVIATDSSDFGVPTWQSTLDRVGAAFDVLYTTTTPLVTDTLVGSDGVGRYNAILLTNSMLLYQDGAGNFVSGLDGDEWNLLWAYERDFGVRQATLYSSYGTFPEDYCLRPRSEGTVGDAVLPAALTAGGAAAFDYLNPSATVPIMQSYVYRTEIAAGCSATAVLTAGSDVLGVQSTSTDGRQRMALTFTSNQYLLQAHLLTYGLFRWASRGLFLGEQRHYLNVDVDDWFNTGDVLLPDGTIDSDPGYEMSGHDAYNTYLQQTALRSRYPLASGFTLAMAYNGGDATVNAASRCWPNGGVERLTATTRCLRARFQWLNHTLTHPEMNFTDYATNVAEINENLAVAQRLGLTVDKTVLKTGEYSGLGVYNPDPNNDTDPPTDFGLGASNQELLRAAKDLGVKYLHGNMSFPSHQPSCFNCGIYHPLEPSLFIVPDWPTNIAYFATTAAQETQFYNSFYGPNGKFPYWPTDLTYDQLMNYETDQVLGRVASGSLYTNTFHIGNLRDYSGGRTLVSDWADRVLAKYSALYRVPVLSPTWGALASYAVGRNAHFAELAAGVTAVYDAATNTVTVTSPASGSLTVSGAQTTGSQAYGPELSAKITLTANVAVSFAVRVMP